MSSSRYFFGPFVALCLIGVLSGCVTAQTEPDDVDPNETLAENAPPHSPLGAAGDVSAEEDGLEENEAAPSALLEEDPFLLDSAFAEPSRVEREGAQIAFLGPLSGPNEVVGRALLEGAQMALFDIGATGAVLMPFDTMGTPAGAEEAARSAMLQGADIVIGPLLSSSVQAATPIVRAEDIPMVSFSNNPVVAQEGVYTFGFSPAQQVRSIIDYATAQEAQRFAVIAPYGAYGELVISTIREIAFDYGIDLKHIRSVDPDAVDYSEMIIEISDYEERRKALLERQAELEGKTDEASKAALERLEQFDTLGDPDLDAILLAADTNNGLRILASQLAFYDVDQPTVRLLGLQLWDSFQDLSNEPSLFGGWYPASESPLLQEFRKRYEQFYGAPPISLASLGYDAMALVAVLAGDGVSPQYDAASLTNAEGFVGVDGLFRLNADGSAERSYAIREITPSGITTIKPAASSFQVLVN